VPAGWRIKTRARAAIERASPSNGQKPPDRCLKGAQVVILPKVRDPRFITIRRGGTLTDSDHQLLAQWAALCAEHVLPLFESARPDDPRPRQAIERARARARGHVTMTEAARPPGTRWRPQGPSAELPRTPHTQRAKPQPSHTSPRTSSAPPPTRSRRRVPQRRTGMAGPKGDSSAVPVAARPAP